MLWESISNSVVDQGLSTHPAIVSDEAELTYEQLLAGSEALADALREIGAGPGHVVLTNLDNVPAFLVAILASARLGAAFAPIDIGATDAEVEGIVALTGSNLVVAGSGDQPRFPDHFDNIVRVDAAGAVTDVQSARLAPPSVDATIGCLQFSSGTTGLSKGMLIGHEALCYRTQYYMRLLGLDASRSHALRRAVEPRPRIGNPRAANAAGGRDAVPEVAEVRVPALHPGGDRRSTASRSSARFPILRRRGEALRRQAPDLRSLRLASCGSAALARSTGAGTSRHATASISNRSTGSRSCTRFA